MNMENTMCDIGVIGLGVMGRNLALNIADHGYAAAGLDRDLEKAKALKTEGGDRKVEGTASMEKFVGLLRRPRAVLLLVPAGKPVDDVIVDLGGRFEKGDLVTSLTPTATSGNWLRSTSASWVWVSPAVRKAPASVRA
jgi:6-phosphogluconate dehydrogenase